MFGSLFGELACRIFTASRITPVTFYYIKCVIFGFRRVRRARGLAVGAQCSPPRFLKIILLRRAKWWFKWIFYELRRHISNLLGVLFPCLAGGSQCSPPRFLKVILKRIRGMFKWLFFASYAFFFLVCWGVMFLWFGGRGEMLAAALLKGASIKEWLLEVYGR